MNSFRAVVFQQGDWWVAHCLEVDLATQSKSLSKLPLELADLLSSQVAVSRELGVEPFQGLRPAPSRYWKMFEDATSRLEPIAAAPVSEFAPAFEARIAA